LNVASGALKVGAAMGKTSAASVVAIQAKIIAAAKLGLALAVVGGAGVGGYGLYDMGRRGGFGVEAPKSASGGRLFDKRPAPARPPEVGVYGGSGAPSGLSLARKANEGAFNVAEEGAEESADAVADEFAEEEVAETEGAAEGGGMPDAAGMAGQMAGALGGGEEAGNSAGSALGRKFGSLSSQMAGGQTSARLSGGGGLSGGIGGKGFGQQKMSKSQMDKMRGLSNGRRANMVQAKRAVGQGRGKGLKGATAKKLNKMQGVMGAARNTNADTAAAAHTQQWDGGDGGGQGIQGGGSSGVGSDGEGGGGGASDGGLPDDGGPVGGGGGGDEDWDDFDTDPCANGSCGNQTPYQGMVDMVIALSVITAILSALIGVVAKIPVYGQAAAIMLCKVVIALGAIIGLCGLAIMGMYGQMVQGGAFVVAGTATAICAYVAMADGGAALKAEWAGIIAGLGGAVSAALGAVVGNNTMGEADENGNVS